jgi:glucose dehydrogenase
VDMPLAAQYGARNGEWRTYGGDLGNTHYSPLAQFNAGNFNQLQVAWRFKTDNFGPRPETNLEGTPLMVNGGDLRDGGDAPRRGGAQCRYRRSAMDTQ